MGVYSNRVLAPAGVVEEIEAYFEYPPRQLDNTPEWYREMLSGPGDSVYGIQTVNTKQPRMFYEGGLWTVECDGEETRHYLSGAVASADWLALRKEEA